MSSRIVSLLFGIWMLAVTAAFYEFPAGHLVLWSTLALSSAGAIGAGVVIHRPSHPMPWWVLAVAVTVFAAGDTTYNVLTTILGEVRPFPSLADVFYLAMYPIAAAGLLLLIHAAHRRPRPGQPARRALRRRTPRRRTDRAGQRPSTTRATWLTPSSNIGCSLLERGRRDIQNSGLGLRRADWSRCRSQKTDDDGRRGRPSSIPPSAMA
jgi:hypothetical protein